MENFDSVTHTTNFLDKAEQKKLVRPYRKYQIIILFMVVSIIIFMVKLFSMSKEVGKLLADYELLLDEFFDLDFACQNMQKQIKVIDINYETLYELNKVPNIETIRSTEELFTLYDYLGYNFENVQLSLCYKATADGDSPSDFRDRCGGLSPLYVIIETTEGYRFGGYTGVPFIGEENKFKRDESAFIFSFDTKNRYFVRDPDKAVFDSNEMFMMFGTNDITISSGCLNNSDSFTNFPSSYEGDKNLNSNYILTGGTRKFRVKELEVLSVYINPFS